MLVGDLVDKGPDSPGVVRTLRELRQAGQPVVLCARKPRRTSTRGTGWPGRSRPRERSPSSRAWRQWPAITEGLSADDIAFLDSAVLLHRLPAHDALVVHGGIPERVERPDRITRRPAASCCACAWCGAPSRCASRSSSTYNHDVKATKPDPSWTSRTVVKKVVRPVGQFLALGEDKPTETFWAETLRRALRARLLRAQSLPEGDRARPVSPRHRPRSRGGARKSPGRGRARARAAPRFVTVAAAKAWSPSLWEEVSARYRTRPGRNPGTTIGSGKTGLYVSEICLGTMTWGARASGR